MDERLKGKRWTKASSCAENSCTEVAIGDGIVGVRNSDDPGTVTVFNPKEWTTFLDGARAGEFDYPSV